MKKVTGIRFLMLMIAAVALTASAFAQTSSPSANGALPNLPQSDALVYLNVRRIIGEALPRVLPEKMQADMRAGIDQIKRKTGIDLNGVENAEIALRFSKMASGAGSPDFVMVVRGAFNADALLSIIRIGLPGKYQEQKYATKTLTTFKMSDLMGAGDAKNVPSIPGVTEVTVTALDAGTLAAGTTEYLKATIDVQSEQNGINPELSALVMRDPNALFSIAGIIPPGFLNGIFGKQIEGNEEISKLVSGIDRAFLSLGMDAANFTVMLSIRTGSAEHARTLSGLADMAVHSIGGDIKDKTAREAFDALTVTVEGTEVILRTAVSQDNAAAFIRSMFQPAVKKTEPATASPKTDQKKPAPKKAVAKKPVKKL